MNDKYRNMKCLVCIAKLFYWKFLETITKNGHQAHDGYISSFAGCTVIGPSMYRVFNVQTRNKVSLAKALFFTNPTACLR